MRDLERAEEVWKILGNAIASGEASGDEYHAAVAALKEAKQQFEKIFSRKGTEPLR